MHIMVIIRIFTMLTIMGLIIYITEMRMKLMCRHLLGRAIRAITKFEKWSLGFYALGSIFADHRLYFFKF